MKDVLRKLEAAHRLDSNALALALEFVSVAEELLPSPCEIGLQPNRGVCFVWHDLVEVHFPPNGNVWADFGEDEPLYRRLGEDARDDPDPAWARVLVDRIRAARGGCN